jgi:hypothetical protein
MGKPRHFAETREDEEKGEAGTDEIEEVMRVVDESKGNVVAIQTAIQENHELGETWEEIGDRTRGNEIGDRGEKCGFAVQELEEVPQSDVRIRATRHQG